MRRFFRFPVGGATAQGLGFSFRRCLWLPWPLPPSMAFTVAPNTPYCCLCLWGHRCLVPASIAGIAAWGSETVGSSLPFGIRAPGRLRPRGEGEGGGELGCTWLLCPAQGCKVSPCPTPSTCTDVWNSLDTWSGGPRCLYCDVNVLVVD